SYTSPGGLTYVQHPTACHQPPWSVHLVWPTAKDLGVRHHEGRASVAKSAKQPGTAAGAGVKRRRRAWRVPAILLALILVAGYAAADAADLAPGILTTTEPWPEAEPFPEPELPAPVSGVQPPAAADEEAPVPKASYVQKITD